jgi:hypothetical protein
VTSLEPRTPHQPEKLKKLSKNEFVFTPFKNIVNRKCGFVSGRIFSRVQPVHKRVTGNCAGRGPVFSQTPHWAGFFAVLVFMVPSNVMQRKKSWL